jgi:hypothetical protein
MMGGFSGYSAVLDIAREEEESKFQYKVSICPFLPTEWVLGLLIAFLGWAGAMAIVCFSLFFLAARNANAKSKME